MSNIYTSPRTLLFGPEIGIAHMRESLAREWPELAVTESVCDSACPSDEAHNKLHQAVAAHAPEAVILVSHSLSLAFDAWDEAVLGIRLYRMHPALADAARLTCTRHVAVLADPAVTAHAAIRRQMTLFAERGLRISVVSASPLQYMAGRFRQGGHMPDIGVLRDVMAPIRQDARIDTVILAATSAMSLRGMLEKAALRPYYWVDGFTMNARIFKASEENLVAATKSGPIRA